MQERTDWRDAAARLSSVSRKAIGALVHYGLLMLRGLTRQTVLQFYKNKITVLFIFIFCTLSFLIVYYVMRQLR